MWYAVIRRIENTSIATLPPPPPSPPPSPPSPGPENRASPFLLFSFGANSSSVQHFLFSQLRQTSSSAEARYALTLLTKH
ncbi:hypothetical protein M0804_006632 [Polistes exclamans]|nr:hypothetical protein M0804_006632 [Polistes exclamans]